MGVCHAEEASPQGHRLYKQSHDSLCVSEQTIYHLLTLMSFQYDFLSSAKHKSK